MDRKEDKVKKSLRYSVLDGSFWSVMAGFGLDYFQAFAVFLRATTLQLGLLSTLPQLIGSLSQLFDGLLMNFFKSKRRFVLFFVALQVVLWLPIAFIGYLKIGSFIVWLLIILTTMHYLAGMITVPIWSAWMGQLVESTERGSYFGMRNRINSSVYFFSYIVAGLFLYYYSTKYTTPLAAFAVMFLVAMIARMFSYLFLSKEYEPKDHFKKDHVGFFHFLKDITKTNYGWLSVYLSLTYFVLFIASPYFAAYLLVDLKFNYLQFALLNAVSILFKLISNPVWGRYSDEYGSLKVLTLSGLLMPAVPLLLIVSPNFYYLIFAQIFSGVAWAGFELATFTFILDTTSPEKRISYISYYNVLQGIFVFIGSLVGVWLASYGFFVWTHYAFLLLVSGILRYAVAFLLLGKLKEVRPVRSIKYSQLLFKIITSLPNISSVHNMLQVNRNHFKK